jgi:uncharacterized membrane protein YjfL (UPF0719 family)
MSPDELLVTVTGVILGPLLWAVWLLQMLRVRALRPRGPGVFSIGLALAACAALVFVILDRFASFDVVDAPQYQFMYVVLGLAWLRAVVTLFPFAGLSPRDDVVERGSAAAGFAMAGALAGVTLCYAGGNIGDGPGWWVVVFSAALATATLLVAWAALAQLTPVADAVTIDRDPSAGMRLGAFLSSCGLILGRGVAGDWASGSATVADFAAALPGLAALWLLAVLIERTARPTPRRPRAPVALWGVVPALLYLAIALAAVRSMGWPA